MTLNEFGFLDATENRMEEARQHYEEALKIDRQLSRRVRRVPPRFGHDAQ